MSVITVSNTAQLMSALKSAKGGETIELEAGNYGSLYLNNLDYSSKVTITSADHSNPASISMLSLANSSNFTFDHLHFDYSYDKGDPTFENVVYARNCENITFSNSEFSGDIIQPGEGVPDLEGIGNNKGSPIEGFAVGSGVRFDGITGLTFVNNDINTFTDALLVSKSSDVVISNNDIHDNRQDGIKMAQVQNIEVSENQIYNLKPWTGPAGTTNTAIGDHSDLIQMFTNGTTQPSVNVVIRDNVLDSGQSAATQAIFMRNEQVDKGLAGNEMAYKNVTITGNIISNAHSAGITVGATEGLVISNNSLLKNPLVTSNMIPGIYVDGEAAVPSTNVTITNNVTGKISHSEYIQFADTSGNLIVDYTNPSAANYYANYYTNILAGVGDSANYQMIGNNNTGSALTHAVSPEDMYIHHVAGDGLAMNKLTFDIQSIMGVSKLDMSKAIVTWRFDDGSTAKGLSVDHVFAKVGTHTATVTISIPGSETVTINKVFKTETAVALDMKFEGTINDMSQIANAAKLVGTAHFEKGRDGDALRLEKGSYVKYAANLEIYGNKSFTISVDFKKDAADSMIGSYRLISFMGGTTIRVGKDEIRLDYSLKDGVIGNATVKVPINDAAWHDLDIVFNGDKGTLTLYLDGKSVLVKSGLSDGQMEKGTWEFSVGDMYSPTGEFKGLIDNVNFLRGEQLPGGKVDPYAELNKITGTDAADKIYAGATNDYILGGSGNDYIRGGKGNDVINGGLGKDQLYGDDGADIFVLDNILSRDTIRDLNFAHGDKIDISALLEKFDPLQDALSDFVKVKDFMKGSVMSVDTDGAANGAHYVDVLVTELKLDLNDMIAKQQLIT